MQGLSEFKSHWPFPRFVYIRIGGEPVVTLANQFKFTDDGKLKGIFGSVGGRPPCFIGVQTFFKTYEEAKASTFNTNVKDIFNEPALM